MEMINKHKLISISSILSGILLALCGIFGVSIYLHTVISSVDHADRSSIFWFLPFLFIGTILVGGGVYFLIIGTRSVKGGESDYLLAKNSVIILTLFIIIIIVIGTVKSI